MRLLVLAGLCQLIMLPKAIAADVSQSQGSGRVPMAIKQEDEHGHPIPVIISTYQPEILDRETTSTRSKPFCLTPCSLYVTPGPMTLRFGGFDSGLRVNTATVLVPPEGLGIILSSPPRNTAGLGIAMTVLGGLALNIGAIVMWAKQDTAGYVSGGLTAGLGLFGLLIPGIAVTASNKSQIEREIPLSNRTVGE